MVGRAQSRGIVGHGNERGCRCCFCHEASSALEASARSGGETSCGGGRRTRPRPCGCGAGVGGQPFDRRAKSCAGRGIEAWLGLPSLKGPARRHQDHVTRRSAGPPGRASHPDAARIKPQCSAHPLASTSPFVAIPSPPVPQAPSWSIATHLLVRITASSSSPQRQPRLQFPTQALPPLTVALLNSTVSVVGDFERQDRRHCALPDYTCYH